ncbi:MAG: Gfo/Idh/MocA family oxidoreductase [Pirellulales bacterium]
MKLGMLGMWHTHADGIVRRVTENPKEFALVGFYDPEPEVVAQRRREWEPRVPGFRVFDSPQKLLAEPLDGVIVEGRVHDNVAMAKLALESGRPVMLEKPAGDRLEDFRKLVDLAQRKHLHVQMIYLFRYMSAVQEMLRRARKGELGNIYAFRARLPKDLPSYDRYVAELGRYKGGMFFEMAGHVIDMMVAMIGPPKSVTPFLAHHHTKPGDFIDNGVAVFGFERAWGIVEVPSLEVAPHARRIEVYGTSGACAIPHLGSGHLANKNLQPIETYQAGADRWETHDLPAATLQIADLREFAAVVSERKKPDFTLEHDLAVQEALLRASNMI